MRMHQVGYVRLPIAASRGEGRCTRFVGESRESLAAPRLDRMPDEGA